MTDGDIKKICIIRLGGFGDIIIITDNELRRARHCFPAAKIDYVVASEFVPLLEGCDFFDRAIGHDRAGGLPGLFPFLKFCSMLRAEKYDLLIDLHDNTRSRLMGKLAMPRRRAFSFPDSCDKPSKDDLKEETKQYMGVDFPGARTPLWLSERDRDFIASLAGGAAGPVIGLCLVGSWETKRWPAGHFAELAEKLIKKMSARIILIGGPSDVAAAREVESKVPGGDVINLAGKTSLSRSVAVTLICSAIVSNDSGMLHAAYLSCVPLVALFGCTDHNSFGYSGPRAITLTAGADCSPCHKSVCPLGTTECMTALAPDRVYSALESLV